MVLEEAVIIAGIGCRPSCPASAILALVAAAGRRPDLIATIDLRLSAPGLLAAAAALDLQLRGFSAADLRRQPTLTAAPAAARHLGTPSVAEAAALAAAGPGGRLILPRIQNECATLALAAGDAA